MKYNIDFEIAGLCFLVLYFLFLRFEYTVNKESSIRFRNLVLVIALADLMDIVTCYTISYGHLVPVWLNIALNTVYFFLAVLSAYCLPIYLRYLLHPDKSVHIFDILNDSVMLIYTVLVVINPFAKLLFTFSSEGEYIHGPLYFILMAAPMFFMLISMIRVIVERKFITTRQLYSVAGFILMGLIGITIQLVSSTNVLLSYYTNALAIGLLMLAFETPDVRTLIRTTQELDESKKQLEKASDKEKETTRIIHELAKSANWEVEVDAEGNMCSSQWSPEFKAMLGITVLDMSSDQGIWSNALHPDDKEYASNAFLSCLYGNGDENYDVKYRLFDKSGTYRWYRGTGELLIRPDGTRLFRGIIRDIHEEVVKEQLNNEIKKALEELEKSQDALKAALVEAENANKAKSVFLSNMSHDIRTPLNAIIGFTDLAMNDASDEEKVKDYLERIQTSGNHLLMLINDVLDMSRIESGKIVIEPADNDIKDVIKSVVDIVKAQTDAKSQQLLVDLSNISEKNVKCDRLRLNQILLNCIGNSIKFTPEEGRIGISVSTLDGRDEKGRLNYRFIITDTGIGMSEEFLKNIFVPFERERNSTISKIQGTGLGMSISKNYVEMMEGTMEVKSKQGKGTTYIITIPFETVTEIENEEGSKAQEINASQISVDEMAAVLSFVPILVVDDNVTNRMIAKGVLGAKGIKVDEADSGEKAIEILRKSSALDYKCVLMDIMMPGMDGYEATEIIRGMVENGMADIPIIAMTANAFEEDKEECFRHGMNGHVSKPFRPDELIRTIYKTVM